MNLLSAEIPNEKDDIEIIKKVINHKYINKRELVRLEKLDFLNSFIKCESRKYEVYINRKGWHFLKWHKQHTGKIFNE